MSMTSSTGASGPSPRARAAFRHPQDTKARCAAPAPGGTSAVARSSARPPSSRSCSSLPVPWRRQDAFTSNSVSANVRPGYSAVSCGGSGVVRPRHQEVDGRSGMPVA
jgi:hypothetical protein